MIQHAETAELSQLAVRKPHRRQQLRQTITSPPARDNRIAGNTFMSNRQTGQYVSKPATVLPMTAATGADTSWDRVDDGPGDHA